MPDAHKNFAISTVATAPSPAASGTSLVVTAGHGARFPAVPFNATVWPADAAPDPTNAEIVRVTARSTDTLTITRAQESTSARTIVVGDRIAATVTALSLFDAEATAGLVGTANPLVSPPANWSAGEFYWQRDTTKGAALLWYNDNGSPVLLSLSPYPLDGLRQFPNPPTNITVSPAVNDSYYMKAVGRSPAGYNDFVESSPFHGFHGRWIRDVSNVSCVGRTWSTTTGNFYGPNGTVAGTGNTLEIFNPVVSITLTNGSTAFSMAIDFANIPSWVKSYATYSFGGLVRIYESPTFSTITPVQQQGAWFLGTSLSSGGAGVTNGTLNSSWAYASGTYKMQFTGSNTGYSAFSPELVGATINWSGVNRTITAYNNPQSVDFSGAALSVGAQVSSPSLTAAATMSTSPTIPRRFYASAGSFVAADVGRFIAFDWMADVAKGARALDGTVLHSAYSAGYANTWCLYPISAVAADGSWAETPVIPENNGFANGTISIVDSVYRQSLLVLLGAAGDTINVGGVVTAAVNRDFTAWDLGARWTSLGGRVGTVTSVNSTSQFVSSDCNPAPVGLTTNEYVYFSNTHSTRHHAARGFINDKSALNNVARGAAVRLGGINIRSGAMANAKVGAGFGSRATEGLSTNTFGVFAAIGKDRYMRIFRGGTFKQCYDNTNVVATGTILFDFSGFSNNDILSVFYRDGKFVAQMLSSAGALREELTYITPYTPTLVPQFFIIGAPNGDGSFTDLEVWA